MSAGVFITSRYKRDGASGTVHSIRVQPETLDLALGATTNAAPAGPAILPSAQVSKGKRSIGINARTVTIKFPSASAPAGYKPDSPITVPWLQDNAAFFDAIPGETSVTYLGVAATLVGKSGESVK